MKRPPLMLTTFLFAVLAGSVAIGVDAGDVQLISRSVRPALALERGGIPTRGESSLSADGRFVVFESDSPLLRSDLNESEDIFLLDRATGELILVSRSATTPGAPADAGGRNAVISADGSTVVFESRSSDLVSGFVDNNGGRQDLYAWDRATEVVRLISHIPGDELSSGDGSALEPLLSADGSLILFKTRSTDLIAGIDANGNGDDLLRWSRATGVNTLVSRNAVSPTTSGNSNSFGARISPDGQWVAFQSLATDLVTAADGNGVSDVFLWNEALGVVLVSHPTAGSASTGNAESIFPRLAADGSSVVFSSLATDLVTGTDTNADFDIFRWDRSSGVTTLISHTAVAAETAGNSTSFRALMSEDGQTVVFTSRATDLVAAADAPGTRDIFRWQSGTGLVTLLSSPDGGATAADGNCEDPRISADGQVFAFACRASNLVPGTDQNGTSTDIFVYREVDGLLSLASRTEADPLSSGDGVSSRPQVSADGGTVLFFSRAGDLVSGADSDEAIFAFETAGGLVEIISRTPAATTDLLISPGQNSTRPTVSDDGQIVVFEGDNLFTRDGLILPGGKQGFAWDRSTGEITLVSRSTAGPLIGGDRNALNLQVSADGSTVVFQSRATDLIAGVSVFSSEQIYAWDRGTQTLRLVSHIPGDPLTGGDGNSFEPFVSADGRRVVFRSGATDLATGTDTNFTTDLFFWDADTGEVKLVSRMAADPNGTADRPSLEHGISADGRYVSFSSFSTNLIPGYIDAGGFPNIYLWDATTGEVDLISPSTAGTTQGADERSSDAKVNADGSAVVFTSKATDLVPGFVPGAGTSNIYYWRRSTGTLQLISREAGTLATGGDGDSFNATVSADGEVVAFASPATNLVPGQADGNSAADVFAWERSLGQVELISRSTTGPATTADAGSFEPFLDPSGGRVIFTSTATDLIPGFISGDSFERHAFVHDRASKTARLISPSTAGDNVAPPLYGVGDLIPSPDGRWVTFVSFGSTLTDGFDGNETGDIYLSSIDEATDADLEVAFGSFPMEPLPPGEPFSLDVVVSNLSPRPVPHAYLTVDLPPSLQGVGASGGGWTCERHQTVLACGRGPLTGSATATLTLDGITPGAQGPVGVGGSTLWPGVDRDHGNNVASVVAHVATDDWGDAPAPYPTLAASDGARHAWSGLRLGLELDVDLDGQPAVMAAGDDADGFDDEDGVTWGDPLIQGQAGTWTVRASGAGVLDAWLDWNGDGDWEDSGEKVFDGQSVVAGGNTLRLTVPPTAALGETFARFRLSSTGSADPTGAAADGEVEDYAVDIEARSDLALLKTATPGPVVAGQDLTYTLWVTNQGPSPSTGATISDPLPPGVSFVSSPEGCSEAGGVVTCPVAAQAPGGSQLSSFIVGVTSGQVGVLANTATVTGAEVDPSLGDNASTVETPIISPSDVSGTMEVLPAENRAAEGLAAGGFLPGDLVTYVVTLSNSGVADQLDNPGPEFLNELPGGLTVRAVSAESGFPSFDAATNQAEWNGSLPAGGRIELTIEATLDSRAHGLVIENQGTIFFDADGDGQNEVTTLTDDPGVGGASDPTTIEVLGLTEVPTLDELGLLLLSLGLAAAGLRRMNIR